MSTFLPNGKIIKLIETLNKAGHEVEAFKVSIYDNYFVVIELQISHVLDYKLTELSKALFSADYQIEELKPAYDNGNQLSKLDLKIIQTNTTELGRLRKILSGIKSDKFFRKPQTFLDSFMNSIFS